MKRNTSLVGNTTKYGLIVDELRDGIASGRLQPGEQLPSESRMLERFSVAKNTLEKAYVILEQEGLIRRERGRGIFVRPVEKSDRKETGFIGYLDLWPEYTGHSPYMLQVLKGMRQAAGQANKNLVLIDSPQTFTQWNDLDGLLLCDIDKIERRQLRQLIPGNLPVVNLLFDDPVFPSVTADDSAGGRLLVEHLISLGHQQIGFLGYHRQAPISLRYQGYRETMLRNGLEPLAEWLKVPDESLAGSYCRAGYFTMQSWLAEGFDTSKCTALLTHNDQVAYGAIRALQEAGLSVPGDISIAGFDGVPHAVLDGVNDEYWQPLPLTTVHIPLFDIASTALQVLLNNDSRALSTGNPLVLPVGLQKGESSDVKPGILRSYDAVGV